ncbi:MAG TPA: DUF3857 domain-containing protein [Edaphobacter sp.]
MAPDYSGESAVIEHFDTVYQMAADGTGWRQATMAVRVQSEAALRQLGVVTIPYAGNSERVEIAYARVRRPDGTVVETPVTEAMEMPDPVTREAPFYSDLKQKQLPIRSLRVGDTLEWQAKVVRTRAEAPGQFWGRESFVEDGVVLSQTLELRVPKDTYVNVWSPKNKPAESIVGGERIIRWNASQKKPSVGKEAEAEKEAKKKEVWTEEQELEATQGKLPSVAWTTFNSWEAVGAWYRGLEGNRMVPDVEIKAKVAEVTAGKATQQEKVRAVYGYVATQIRYVGVAFGVGRYQPHTAAEVLQNQYGDCKDKHTLLAAMLAALDLHADAVLIGAGVRFNEAVPSPSAFNHLITAVPLEGETAWLDATAEVAPYRMLMFAIRDKSALAVPESNVARVVRTPATLPFASFQKMDAVGTLDKDGISNSRLVLTLRGDDELTVRTVLRQVAPAQYEQLVQQLSRNMGYGGTTSHAELSRPEDTAEPLKISYDYKREKAGEWDNYRIVPQVAPVMLPRPDEKDPPVRSILLGVPRVELSTSALKLPDGWGVELPESVHAKSAYATYDETYKFENGTLYAERRIEVLKDKVPVADWKSYKKWADSADLGNELYVQLTRTGGKTASGDTAEKGPPVVTETNAKAAALITSAFSALQRRELDSAESMLDQAKNLNAQQPWLWLTYGTLNFARGELSAAIEDCKKELSVDREQYRAYSLMAQAQEMLGQRKEAEKTLQQWTSVEESIPAPSIRLVSMLLEDKDGAAAVKVAESAVARLPEDKKKDEALQLQLGKAQLMAGMKEKGRATLLAVLQTTQSPEMMNDSAYELSDAHMELPLAEATTRTALTKISEESKTWTLDENPQVLKGKSRLLVAAWDTIGWILFQEGKLDEAESYLNAAWLNGQSAEVGEHLGELLTAKGNKNAALKTYELALATIPPYDIMGVKKAPGAEEKKLKERTEALRQAGAKVSLHDSHKALQEIRTISLGPANGLNGTVEYRLLLSEGGIERAEAMGLKELEGGAERVKKARFAGFWPTGSNANLVRSGILNCHSGVCELVLEP